MGVVLHMVTILIASGVTKATFCYECVAEQKSEKNVQLTSYFSINFQGQVIRNESQTNRQPIRFNLDVKFAGPSYLRIRTSVYIILIRDPYIFNLYNS